MTQHLSAHNPEGGSRLVATGSASASGAAGSASASGAAGSASGSGAAGSASGSGAAGFASASGATGSASASLCPSTKGHWQSPWHRARWPVAPAVALAVSLGFLLAAVDARAESGTKPAAATPPSEVGPKPKPVPARDPKQIDAAVQRGFAFLLKRQNANGSWGSSGAPGRARLRARARGPPGVSRRGDGAVHLGHVGSRAATARGGPGGRSRRGVAVGAFAGGPPATPDAIYNNWTHAYAIQALVRMLHRRPGDAERMPQDPRADRAADRHARAATSASTAAGPTTTSTTIRSGPPARRSAS